MRIIYPESWSPLSYPQTRAELIEYLKDAVAEDLFRTPHEVEFLIHFIFDDSGEMFWPDASQSIGHALLDAKEAAALQPFVSAFHEALGSRSKRVSAITAAEWLRVSSAAKPALEALALRGLPTYTQS